MPKTYDVAVAGAGSFGAWIAWHLRRAGRSVALLDAYGAGNNRASSGGESRISRATYGADAIYTRWALRSLAMWRDLFEHIGEPSLFQQCGVLTTAPEGDDRAATSQAVLKDCGVPFETLSVEDVAARFPQFCFAYRSIGILEPSAGALLARRAVQAVVRDAVRNGADYFRASVRPPEHGELHTESGETIAAAVFIFACGPWLPKIFPELLEGRIRATRQEVFFFGTPPGDRSFTSPAMPAWVDFSDARGGYAVPDIENRGFKLAFDKHGPPFDPDSGNRVANGLDAAREYLAERFPALRGAPLLESRVCQYENTCNGDFLIDRHPDLDNVWLVGGGSGHGFKHGPAVGEYVAARIDGSGAAEPRFSLETKTREPARTVF